MSSAWAVKNVGCKEEMFLERALKPLLRRCGERLQSVMLHCNDHLMPDQGAAVRMLVGARTARLVDQIGIGLSGICLVHCLSSTILLALLAAAGSTLFSSPPIHEAGLLLALPLGAFALGRGVLVHRSMFPVSVGSLGLGVLAGSLTLPHGNAEVLYTIIGVSILALDHDLNRRATT